MTFEIASHKAYSKNNSRDHSDIVTQKYLSLC